MVRSHYRLMPPVRLIEKIDQRLVGATTESLCVVYPRLWRHFSKTTKSDTPLADVIFAAVYAIETHEAFPREKLCVLRKMR